MTDALSTSALIDDFADRAVPAERQYRAARIGITTGAWIIAMSTFFTGGVLAGGMEVGRAAAAAVIGQLFLGVIGFLTALAGAQLRLTTAMIARRVYGETGGRAVALGIGLVLGVGWFAWQLSFFGQTITTSFGGHALTGAVPAMIWGAAITTFTVLFGFRLLSTVSAFAVPAILILSFYGLSLSIGRSGGIDALLAAHGPGPPIGLVAAIGLVIGNGVVGTVMFPDLSRFARRPVAGAAAAAGGYALAGIVILLCGAAIVYAARAKSGDLPGAMQAVGLGVPAFIVLIVAQWATNKGNLYSGALSLSAATGWQQSRVTVALGAAGLLVALAGIQDQFVPLLVFLGNFMPPLAAGMAVHVLALPQDTAASPRGLWAVLAGGLAGYAAGWAGWSVPAPAIAFLTAAILYPAILWWRVSFFGAGRVS